MRIAKQLGLVALVPLLGSLSFGLYIGRDALKDASSAKNLASINHLMTRAGSAVHEIQIERGYSATYISSQGKQFGPELAEQRKKVDVETAVARGAMSSVDGGKLHDSAKALLQKASVDLDQNLSTLIRTRAMVDRQEVKVPEVIKAYSQAVDTLIDLGQLAGAGGEQHRINDLSKTLVGVLEAKENAGLERAFGSAELARGVFDLNSAIRMVDLSSQQRVALRTAARLADPMLRQMLVDLEPSTEGKQVEQFRAQMLASLASGDLGKLTAEQWFAATSARIDKMKNIQNAISNALDSATVEMAASARMVLAVTLVSIALVILISILASLLMGRSLVRAVRAVAQAVANIKEGTKDVVVPELGRSDEIGDVARCVDMIRTLGRDSTLIVSALKGSSTMLMATDGKEHITFMSPALVAHLGTLEPTLRQGNPNFAVAAMIGEHIDYYRTNSNLQRHLLLDDGKLRQVRYEIGGSVIDVEMTYIVAADGEKVGHTLLWKDITKELAAQKTVSAVVAAAARGDFSERVPTADATGFVKEIAEGLNAISATVEEAIGDVGVALRAVATGDLTHSSKMVYEGTIGALQADIANTVERLSDTIARLQASTSTVSQTAAEIEAGADDLSRRTEDQASSLEQTAATTEELAASVKATAQSSRRAVALSEEAADVARTGGSIVANAVGAMSRIEQASHRISDIIGVIDEIAFQTNLLALNAAVEAARAGDAGRGFAVVASEVRALAQRSSAAAKDISALISSSNGEVTEGVKLVKTAGEVLTRIVEASQNVSAMVSEISTATGEQASGIEEMSQAVAHMDGMTQQNAAMSEQSVASAQSLAAQTVELTALAARFTVKGSKPSEPYAKPTLVRQVA